MDIKLFSNGLKFKYRVAGIIVNNNKVLVNKYDKDRFCLPGGYVEVGETSLEAIKREIKEELQININDAEYIGIIENFFTNFKGDKTHGLEFYYKINVSDGEIKNIDMNYIENDKGTTVKHNFKWIPINELNLYNIVPSQINNIIQNNENNFHYIVKD